MTAAVTREPAGQRQDTGSGVAIVVVCYNQAHFLRDALESALGQSLPADEIVLVDDGSVDHTAEIAACFPAVRYLRQRNAGLSAARNTGLRAVTAPFVLFLDSDDRLDAGAIAAALPVLRADRARAFVYGGYREVGEDLRPRAVIQPKVYPNAFLGLLENANHIAMHGTVLYDASILLASGGFDTSLKSCEDYDVYLRLTRTYDIAAYPLIAADYRRHGNSMSRDKLKMIDAAQAVLERHSRGRSERAFARRGLSIMIEYYGAQLLADLAKSARRGSVGEIFRLLVAVAWRPGLRKFVFRRVLGTIRSRLVPSRR
ncbi:glycosyltransferase family 2 protein [Methylobacterium sp. P31]